MRNSPWLPATALTLAVVLALYTTFVAANAPGPLSEIQLGMVAAALGLGIFGIQGIISVATEGNELMPGRIPPRLTGPFSLAITILGIALLLLAGFLAYGIMAAWQTNVLGLIAGVACIVIAVLLVFYKEAFVGDQACFEDRDDGVPW